METCFSHINSVYLFLGVKIRSHLPPRGETVVKSNGFIPFQVVVGGQSMLKLRAKQARKRRRSNIAILQFTRREKQSVTALPEKDCEEKLRMLTSGLDSFDHRLKRE
jgi:hypothetical protein